MEMRQIVDQEGREAKNLLIYQYNGSQTTEMTNSEAAPTANSPRRPPRSPNSLQLPHTPTRKAHSRDRLSISSNGGPRVRSASTGRDKKSELQARYWALLFGNLQRAVNEIYQTCECYENISSCQEAILVLENYVRDFKALSEWFKVSWDYESRPVQQRPQSLAWEVRKSNPVPRARTRSLTSPTTIMSGHSSPCVMCRCSQSGKSSPCGGGDVQSPRKSVLRAANEMLPKGALRVNLRELFASCKRPHQMQQPTNVCEQAVSQQAVNGACEYDPHEIVLPGTRNQSAQTDMEDDHLTLADVLEKLQFEAEQRQTAAAGYRVIDERLVQEQRQPEFVVEMLAKNKLVEEQAAARQTVVMQELIVEPVTEQPLQSVEMTSTQLKSESVPAAVQETTKRQRWPGLSLEPVVMIDTEQESEVEGLEFLNYDSDSTVTPSIYSESTLSSDDCAAIEQQREPTALEMTVQKLNDMENAILAKDAQKSATPQTAQLKKVECVAVTETLTPEQSTASIVNIQASAQLSVVPTPSMSTLVAALQCVKQSKSSGTTMPPVASQSSDGTSSKAEPRVTVVSNVSTEPMAVQPTQNSKKLSLPAAPQQPMDANAKKTGPPAWNTSNAPQKTITTVWNVAQKPTTTATTTAVTNPPLKYSSVVSHRPPALARVNSKVNTFRSTATSLSTSVNPTSAVTPATILANKPNTVNKATSNTSLRRIAPASTTIRTLPAKTPRNIPPAPNAVRQIPPPQPPLASARPASKAENLGPPKNVATRLSSRSRTMVDLNPNSKTQPAQPQGRTNPLPQRTTVKSSGEDLGSSSSTLKASSEHIESPRRHNLVNGANNATDERPSERQSEPKQMPHSEANGGWYTVKNRRRSTTHWNNRFNQPTGYASLPTLPLMDEKKAEREKLKIAGCTARTAAARMEKEKQSVDKNANKGRLRGGNPNYQSEIVGSADEDALAAAKKSNLDRGKLKGGNPNYVSEMVSADDEDVAVQVKRTAATKASAAETNGIATKRAKPSNEKKIEKCRLKGGNHDDDKASTMTVAKSVVGKNEKPSDEKKTVKAKLKRGNAACEETSITKAKTTTIGSSADTAKEPPTKKDKPTKPKNGVSIMSTPSETKNAQKPKSSQQQQTSDCSQPLSSSQSTLQSSSLTSSQSSTHSTSHPNAQCSKTSAKSSNGSSAAQPSSLSKSQTNSTQKVFHSSATVTNARAASASPPLVGGSLPRPHTSRPSSQPTSLRPSPESSKSASKRHEASSAPSSARGLSKFPRQTSIKRQMSDLTGLKSYKGVTGVHVPSLSKEYERIERKARRKQRLSNSDTESVSSSNSDDSQDHPLNPDQSEQQKINIKIQTNRDFSKTIGDLYESISLTGRMFEAYMNGSTGNGGFFSCDETEESLANEIECDEHKQRMLVEEQESLERQIAELESTEIDVDTETDETDCEVIMEHECESDERAMELDDDASTVVFVHENDEQSLELRYQALLSEMSWGERAEALATLQAYVARHPGRAQELHQKLSSPSRRRSLHETLRKYQAKQARAQAKRELLQRERANKIQQLLARVEDVKTAKMQLIEDKRLKMEDRQQRAAQNREQYLRQIKEKAHDEGKKLKEINFIKHIEQQNKRLDLMESFKETEVRLQDLEQERQKRLEEKAAKEAAAERRRQELERERLRKLEKMNETRLEKEQRIEEMQEQKERTRQALAREKARDREQRLLALQVQQQQSAEELQRKILQKQQESARRHEENIEHIRQRALELTIPTRNVDENGQQRTESNVESATGEEGEHSSTVSDVSGREHTRAYKKKLKKLKQKMAQSGEEYLKELPELALSVRRSSQVPRYLNLIAKGGGPQSLERCLGQLFRLIEKHQADDFLCLQLLNGQGVIATHVFNKSLEPDSHISRKALAVGTHIYRVTCSLCPQLARSAILNNTMPVLFDILLHNWQLPEEKSTQQPVELSTEILLAISTVLSQYNMKIIAHPKVMERLPDLVSYAVMIGLPQVLANRCSSVREPIEDNHSLVLSILSSIGFLTRLADMCPRGSIDKKDSTRFLSVAKSSEMFGTISMAYAVVVPQGEFIPARTISLAAATFHLLVSMAVLDLATYQEILNTVSLSHKFVDVITILIKYCGSPDAELKNSETKSVLIDMIASIGFLCVNNRQAQDLLASEQCSIILKYLTKLHSSVDIHVYPCLLAATFQHKAAYAAVSRDFNMELLEEYGQSDMAKKHKYISLLKRK